MNTVVTRRSLQLQTKEAKKSYHHGSLREAALATARSTVVQHGHEAVTMRGLAGQLDVTPGALYRHFNHRSALLGALANGVHEHLQCLLKAAIAEHEDPRAALRAGMRSFLEFADAHAALFRMTYDEELVNAPGAEEQLPALAKNYEMLTQLLARAVPDASPSQVRLRMIALWSLIFGYACVRTRRLLKPYMLQGLAAEQIEQTVLDAALGMVDPHATC